MHVILPAAAVAVLVLAGCQREASQPTAADATASTVDASGAAPPQPSPYGGDTPTGVAGPGGVSPNAAEAVRQGEPQDPGMTAQPEEKK